MALARVESFLLDGIDALPCEVEVDVSDTGQSKHVITGLPQAAVKESLERVNRAVANSGFKADAHRLVVHLAPAGVKKDGPALDLPIAVGLLRATRCLESDADADYLVAGELALDGRVRPVRGVLSLAMLARERGKVGVIVPLENVPEAAVVDGVEVVGVTDLSDAARFLLGHARLPVEPPTLKAQRRAVADFADVRGQELVKRAMVLAAAGGHNVLMVGPPGTGKTMIAKRVPGILPPLTRAEALETTRVYSAMGRLPTGVSLLSERPFRAPHHSATAQALVGGGSVPRPGEVSMAHHGVLFLDELPEFSRYALEMLRQPMEGDLVTVARVHGTATFPAAFMLVAAMNPSHAGGGDVTAGRGQNTRDRDKYLAKLSGPLMDRIDLHVEVPAVPHAELMDGDPGTDTATMRRQVADARDRQAARQGGVLNARLAGRDLDAHAALPADAKALLKQALDDLGLSARAYDKVRRVARTLADIEGGDAVDANHIAEAIGYRLLDRRF